MSRPARLLEEFDADITVVFAARIAILLQRGNSSRPGGGHDIDIGYGISGHVGGRLHNTSADDTQQKTKMAQHTRILRFQGFPHISENLSIKRLLRGELGFPFIEVLQGLRDSGIATRECKDEFVPALRESLDA